LGGGDYEEHAIMLCNYFNYIDSVVEVTGCKSYLVYGMGMPEGFTVYVMRKNEDPNKE
jgi:coiled-coil and C2 domain-containing protein 2A